ncbi:MAG TPA: NFACT RNA binding domain-containing protein [Polyangia bacterium]|nr:NFACT RNA binding domain-containing protein [Polyangia bacterium]
MSLSSTEIGRVAGKLDRELRGAALRKVLSPVAGDRLVLELRLPGANALLQLVIAPKACRLGRIPACPALAASPHPFVMLLRRDAVGLRVETVAQLASDRAVEIHLAAGERTGRLVAELTGRHANLFWLDGDGSIRGSFHQNRSHARPLVPGQPYRPLLPRPPRSEADRFGDGDGIERAAEDHYTALEAGDETEVHRRELGRDLRRAASHIERLLRNLEGDRLRSEEGERLQGLAHVLQANLRLVEPGMRSLAAVDFEGCPVEIPLDPSLGPGTNLGRLFDRAGRLRRAAPRVEERISEMREKARRVADLAGRLPDADTAGLEGIATALGGILPAKGGGKSIAGGRTAERLPYREYLVGSGRPARVGRSAADNDRLTLRHARPDDLWLHARGMGGSHVVVPMGRGEEPGPDLLVDAAHLAAHFSKARGEEDVEVTWTRRRYVQKPRGAPPGSVRLLQEKTILVRLEPARLARILGRELG